MEKGLLDILYLCAFPRKRNTVSNAPRSLAFVLVGLFSLGALGQDGELRSYRARVHPTATGVSPKSMIVAVSEWLPVVEIDVDREARVLSFTTVAVIDLAQLREHLEATGYQAGGFECLTSAGIRTMEGVPPFPEFQDTGDNAVDYARYDAAKAAWVAAYPDMYHQLMHPTHPVHGRK